MTEPGAEERGASRWLLSAIVLSVVIITALRIVVAAVTGDERTIHHLVFAPLLLGYPLVGVLILRRRRHPIGWLLVSMGLLLVVNNLAEQWTTGQPRSDLPAWAVLLLVVASAAFPLFAMLIPVIGYRFPDGRLVGSRWRWPERAYATGVAAVATGMVLAPELLLRGDVEWTLINPVSSPATERIRPALELLAVATLPIGIVGAVAAIVVRFRRSEGIERLQLRWLVFAVLAVLLTWPVVAAVAALLGGSAATGVVSAIYSLLVLAAPVVGLSVAVTRYRLYEIDRVVSRTVGYGLVSLVLVATYAAVVLAAQQLLEGREAPDVVIAGATLAVAALFRPVRHRVQSRVDRRFDRRAYDGERVNARFATRLRDEVDLGTVATELTTTTIEALHPSTVSLWLGPAPAGDR